MTPKFHNPYNFVPTPPRGGEPEGLRDGAPAGHHRWHEDLLSGELQVRMTAVTPMLVPTEKPDADISRLANEPAEHKHLKVAVAPDAEGVSRVDLPTSSIRGMLRSAFETVTNSRFAVFDHPERLGYRSAANTTRLRPALVHSDERVELLGDLVLGKKSTPAMVSVPAWRKDGDNRPWRLGETTHRQRVNAVIVFDKFQWRAESLLFDDADEIRLSDQRAEDRFEVRGVLQVGGPSIEPKQAERLFVTEIIDGGQGLTQQPSSWVNGAEAGKLVDELRALVEHQRNIHAYAGRSEIRDRDGRRPWEYLGGEPGRTAWSRHLYKTTKAAPTWVGPDTVLPPAHDAPPLPCWLEPGPNGRLRPVMISRRLHDQSPQDLLDPSLWPATVRDQLSAADRVFGWTAPEGTGAHRAQLRVTNLTCPPEAAVRGLSGLTLPPLSAPKPSQGRFYLGTPDPDRTVRPIGPGVERADLFTEGQTLRGRKVYPHQRWMESATDHEREQRLRHTPPAGRNRRDSQNATIFGWIKPGAEFTFTCQFQDLRPMELGALLWLLNPTTLGRAGQPGRLRLGWGKPLGFGSVELTVTGSVVRTGQQVADRLRSLGARGDTASSSTLSDEFEQAMSTSPQLRHLLESVRLAAIGFADDVPVDYPRTVETGPSYEWFVANDQRAGNGKAQSLPMLGEPPLRRQS